MNIDLLQNNAITEKYNDIVHSNGYNIINKIHKSSCTRVHNSSGSIKDHAITDLFNLEFFISMDSHCFTDHESLCIQINFNNQNLKNFKILNLWLVVDYNNIIRDYEHRQPSDNITSDYSEFHSKFNYK